jgi:toxin HigB-1
VIKSFRCRHTEALFRREWTKRFGADLIRTAQRKLQYLDAAESLEDVKMPHGNRLEPLKGDRAGQWSIRINDQWRICFVWRDQNAWDVEIVDYH